MLVTILVAKTIEMCGMDLNLDGGNALVSTALIVLEYPIPSPEQGEFVTVLQTMF
jgi:hypothetical protein